MEPPVAPTASLSTVIPNLPSPVDLALQGPVPNPVVPGAPTVYTMTVYNHGPGLATGVVLTNALPGDMAPVWTRPAQPACRRQEQSIHCDVGDQRRGDAVTVALDLSVGGSETPITGTHLAGVTWTLSAPTCTIDPDPTQPQVTCHLPSLQPGSAVQIAVGANTTGEIAGSLVHTLAVSAQEDDVDPTNNKATFTMTVGSAVPLSSTTIPTTIDLVLHADGPSSIIAGQPVTYTYLITNQGKLAATGVFFEDEVPSDMNLVAYEPGLPLCTQQGDILTCQLRDLDGEKTITFTLVTTGYGGQPIKLGLDPLAPGWPICTVIKESTWLHILQCELGSLEPGQSARVRMVLKAIGVRERTTTNTATVQAREIDPIPQNNAVTTTAAVRIEADLVLRSEGVAPADAGQAVSYTLTIANGGPSDADDVVFTDTLPAGATVVSAVTSRGDECQVQLSESSTESITCGLGRLVGGETATVSIVIATDETGAHTARVAAKPLDPNLNNNELTEPIPVSSGFGD